jgi:NADPH:quinone reductase-like Zn-dependent oxidoreductase
MQAITVSDREAGVAGLSLTDLPHPEAASNDVVVRVHAAGFIPTELDWPDTWTDRAGRDRTPSVPGHDLSGVVVELGYGTTGLSVGQRVFGLADWARNGSLAEYTAVEARNLAPLPIDIDHTVASRPTLGRHLRRPVAWPDSQRSLNLFLRSPVRVRTSHGRLTGRLWRRRP